MTDAEKGMIIAFFYCLGSIAQVASLVGRPWSTIKSFLTRTSERMSVENIPRPARPPLLSRQQRCTIVQAAKSNRQTTRSEFRDKYAPGVSLATGKCTFSRVIAHDCTEFMLIVHIVDRVLREANMKKWIAKSRPQLKPEHIAKRLKWAIAHKDWTSEDFEGVIWSDECSVEKSKDPRQQWVFREPGEKWLHDCVHPKEKNKGISLMVWGCFGVGTKVLLSLLLKISPKPDMLDSSEAT